MSNAENKIAALCPSINHPVITNPEFEQPGKRAAKRFPTSTLTLERPLDRSNDAQRLFLIQSPEVLLD